MKAQYFEDKDTLYIEFRAVEQEHKQYKQGQP